MSAILRSPGDPSTPCIGTGRGDLGMSPDSSGRARPCRIRGPRASTVCSAPPDRSSPAIRRCRSWGGWQPRVVRRRAAGALRVAEPLLLDVLHQRCEDGLGRQLQRLLVRVVDQAKPRSAVACGVAFQNLCRPLGGLSLRRVCVSVTVCCCARRRYPSAIRSRRSTPGPVTRTRGRTPNSETTAARERLTARTTPPTSPTPPPASRRRRAPGPP